MLEGSEQELRNKRYSLLLRAPQSERWLLLPRVMQHYAADQCEFVSLQCCKLLPVSQPVSQGHSSACKLPSTSWHDLAAAASSRWLAAYPDGCVCITGLPTKRHKLVSRSLTRGLRWRHTKWLLWRPPLPKAASAVEDAG